MDVPLLSTKFHIPKTDAGTVSRPRLIDKLSRGIGHRLTVVSAPAGFGKTTLLSEWVGNSGHPTIWLSLDANENDPTQFWLYFIGALQRLESHLGAAAVDMLQTVPPPPLQAVLTTLINEISDKLPEFLIVLDDYHLITSRPIHDALTFLLDHVPPNMHLVIAGRADPQLPISRLRANSQLTELRADDLRFTKEETEALFHKLMVTGLPEEDISVLVARTEGWIVGLQMAALSMKGRQDSSKFVATFSGSNRYILDYLTDEVLTRQENKMQSFLLQTSILERLNGSLCDVVTGRSDGQQMLEQLEEANLFVTPLDDERRWYRYHQLFADLLRNQLMRTQSELSRVLYLRASAWFEKEGLITEAIQYALAGDDPEKAAKLSESIAMELIAQNRAATVSEWMSRLPEDLIVRHPKLYIAGAWASLAMRRFDDVEKFIRQASIHLPFNETQRMDHYERNLYFHILTLNAFLARFRGEFANSIEQSTKAADFTDDADQIILGTATLNLGISYWNIGNLQSGREHLEKASKQASEAGNYYCTLTSMSAWAEIEAELGHLKKAASICEKAIALGTNRGSGHPLPTAGYALVSLSQVLREWNRLDDAEAVLLPGIQLGETSTEPELRVRAYLSLARLKQARGDFDAVADAFRKAYAVQPVFAYLRNQVSAWEAQLWLSQEKLDHAVRWANAQESQLELTVLPDFAREVQYLTVLRVKLAKGEAEEILAPLECLRVYMETQERTSGTIDVLTLQSLALGQLGKTDEAMLTLERALHLAEPEGYTRIFIDHGTPMQQLLRYADRKGIAHDYVRILLRAFQPAEQQVIPATEMFNEQEKAILRLISSGLSNKEIGKELYLSLNTIKWYSSQIYSKLEVSSRAEAVKRAHDLNLL